METTTTNQAVETVELRWIRPAHWQKLTGMSRQAIYRSLRSGQLRGALVGRTWFIQASELTDFFERERVSA